MLAHLAEALGDTQMAVRIGKAAIARGMNLDLLRLSDPFAAQPTRRCAQPPEPAFILGIARQESEFNSLTLSGAGARGILQVMPVTAKHVCRDYKIKCDIPRLMKDPAYNTMLGSAYISDRMDEFTGSYVLTLAGYNAGPGRAREWIKEFGDPRDGKVDPIDWIHRIPFEETREYVQKVLSNIQVYRARLGEEECRAPQRRPEARCSARARGAISASAVSEGQSAVGLRQVARSCGYTRPQSTDCRNRIAHWYSTQVGLACARPDPAGNRSNSGVSPMRPTAQTWRRHPLHLARRAAALCAALPGARLDAPAGGVPGGPHRNSRDFHDLATVLASPRRDGTRRLRARQPRARALAARPPTGRTTRILVELNDALDFMTMKDLDRAAVIGTSRGGLIAMLMAVLRPNAMGAVGAERHRPRDRARGPRPHRRLRRPRAAAGGLGGGDRARHEMNRRQFTDAATADGPSLRAPALQRRQRPAGAGLRP